MLNRYYNLLLHFRNWKYRLICALFYAVLLVELNPNSIVPVSGASYTTATVTVRATSTETTIENSAVNKNGVHKQLPPHYDRLHHRRHHRNRAHQNHQHHGGHKQPASESSNASPKVTLLDEETVLQVRMCFDNITTMELCQRCASITKSMTVFPLCCADVDGIQGWCQEYLDYGLVV